MALQLQVLIVASELEKKLARLADGDSATGSLNNGSKYGPEQFATITIDLNEYEIIRTFLDPQSREKANGEPCQFYSYDIEFRKREQSLIPSGVERNLSPL